jgi:ribonucleoside-diphosphate reductase alpha chain
LATFEDPGPLPAFFVESDTIDWQQRIAVQSVIQQNIDHSISSTINLAQGNRPRTSRPQLYMEGWKQGLKGVTVYVDGSRSGVLITDKEEDSDIPSAYGAPSAPLSLNATSTTLQFKARSGLLWWGSWTAKPYEVMGGFLI